MPEITSNDSTEQLGIYAGIAAGGTALGLAYGADAFSPLYNSDKAAATKARKESQRAKDQAMADAVAKNETRRERKARERAVANAQERVERGSRYAGSDARVHNVDNAHRMANSVNNVLNERAAEQAHREARIEEKFRNQRNGTVYNPASIDMSGIVDTVELGTENYVPTPQSPTKKKMNAKNFMKNVLQRL